MRRILLFTLWFACLPMVAQADEASGTWSGQATVGGDYYWERSTRVVAPEARLSIETPAGPRIQAGYLLDMVTSASQAQGVQDDLAFTENRHDASLGIAHEVDLGESQLDLAANARFSREPDYLSRGMGFSAAWSFNQRLSTVSVNGYFIRDDVGRVVRRARPTDLTRLFDSEREHVGDLNALSLGLSWRQVLTPTTVMALGYDVSSLDGFQANVHRLAPSSDGPPRRETHPELRSREAAWLQLSQRLVSIGTTLQVSYRYYWDTWALRAHTSEFRVYQSFGDYFTVRLLGRYYTQGDVFFYEADGYEADDRYRTFDPKMQSLRNLSYGFKSMLSLDFLSFTALDFAHGVIAEFSFEVIDSTGRQGNGVLSQAGVTWPF